MIRPTATLLALFALAAAGAASAPERVVPDDPFFSRQVSFEHHGGHVVIDRASYTRSPVEFQLHEGIHHDLTRAWAVTTGSAETRVALLDDGFFYDHEDLIENIWRNPGETGLDAKGYPRQTNGVDDDANGYVDDVVGWDFVFEDPDPDCYIFDGRDMSRIQPYWHSIDALGIIGAKGNNGIGVAGINWSVSMMLLKTAAQGDTGGEHRIPRTARAVRYAVDNGARVINWSGWVPVKDLEKLAPLQEAFDYAEEKGVLIVVAAGNEAEDLDLEENSFFPACATNENVIAVAEVDFDGTLYRVPEGSRFVGGSNYGPENVDIAAFAQNYSTHVRHARPVYRISGGTSNAAPVVTGVAALVFSLRPELDASSVKKILMQSAKKLPALEGKIASGGMVDAYRAVTLALSNTGTATGKEIR